ncbi:Salivary acidic proline-rich phosphoprotein 1/2 [Recurvomyces mirabilis]|uniref:RNA helicase n=1 Tax=Recurvomyces mirabilis TaxID=574656 RepID=A0AAE0TMR3_9PEZI|nr:Salivary acidic proline-rich phosphoprotein 1/2 [Recurvomyces mirabilis]KAK5159601.1 Salivary acidic proline-rich phosphoprotein 1/2 [Recurvomyces mirabilis]
MEVSRPLKRKHEDGTSNLQAKRVKLLDSRKLLPIWPRQKDIRQYMRQGRVLILSGETGSGKSTQIPQFLLHEPWCKSGKIAVTQPRRVAAISLARRVAEELGSPLGSSSPASKVGYSVRFDDNTSPGTRIKFLTEGMLLQEMLRDADLKQYGCIIIDEVHERSVNVDLLLGFLKGLVRKRRELRVVVMSATADVEGLRSFFEDISQQSDTAVVINGTDATAGNGADDQGSWDGFSDDVSKPGTASATANGHSQNDSVTTCHVEGRQYPVITRYLDIATEDVIAASLNRIFQIHCKEPMPGDILAFMTGQESIQSLQKLVEEYAQGLTSDYPKLLVLPLFAALPQAAQQRIFLPAPRNTRKVILSTNIAETSVTVPGVRFVVDTGKAKIKQFRNSIGLDSLLIKPISRSSADQRQGRAGREAAGQCYRLYTQQSYQSLDQDPTPEILRCDLSQAVLTMKARGVDDILGFPFLTSPSREALEKALLHLYRLGALQDDGKISPAGRQIARLPLTPSLGRVVIEAAKPEKQCLPHVIDIVACLSVETIWLSVETEEARERAQIARQQLQRRQGDHLTLLAAVQGYTAENSDRKRWVDDHLISHRAMRNVMDVRKQLWAQCLQAKLLPKASTSSIPTTTQPDEETSEKILRCFLAGFSTNTAHLCPDGSYKTFSGNQTVAIHPSSWLFGRKAEGIVYQEFVFTSKAYARNVSVVQLGWLDDILA